MEELRVMTSGDKGCMICWDIDSDEELVKAIRKLRYEESVNVGATVEEFLEQEHNINVRVLVNTVRGYLINLAKDYPKTYKNPLYKAYKNRERK